MKKFLSVLLLIIVFITSIGALAACEKNVSISFVSENGYECESKTVTNAKNGAVCVYWEIKHNDEVVAYIAPCYVNKGEFVLYEGKLLFNIYIPYCDVTDFVLKVNDVALIKPALSWRIPFDIETEDEFNREMPQYYFAPETIYSKNVNISIEGIDASKLRGAEINFVLGSSTYFALSDGTSDGRKIVNKANLLSLVELGYNISIADKIFKVNSINTVFEVATIKLKVTDLFAFYCAVDREGLAYCYINSYDSRINVVTDETPLPEGSISFKSVAQISIGGVTKRDIYKYQVMPFYGIYYIF